MLFNSFPFAIFFGLTVVALTAAPRFRVSILLGASLLFYALWIPRYLALLLVILAVNYLLLVAIERGPHRKACLVLSIVFTLSVLAVFKYAAFALELALPLLRGVFAEPISKPSFDLPLGISFYSFEIISLSVDVYGGRLRRPSFGRYALFVTFFPHLIAGPILRGEELFPQLETASRASPEQVRGGVWLVARGLVKKTLFADFLLAPFVTEIFAAPGAATAPAHLVALYSFAFLIYFDFSGYTDMARGLARMLGLELPENFLQPYLSRNPAEFWRRWHRTLSRWLRDYVYVPLGGNRKGPGRTLIHLMLTMLLGGLWHGAGINFVLWGALHGALLAVHRRFGARADEERPLAFRDVPSVVLTFHAVCFAWIPFRAATWVDTIEFVHGFLQGGWITDWPLLPTLVVGLCVATHLAERWLVPALSELGTAFGRAAWGPIAEGAALGFVLTTAVLASGAGAEFIYFQF